MEGKQLNILFIGNSHTYYNDMPFLVCQCAEEAGFDCRVAMLAHGGWHLAQHAEEQEVRFNILYGRYDYVILQEHAHPFAPEKEFLTAVTKLCQWIREAGSRPVLYESWARHDEPEKQANMNEIYRFAAKETTALIAPVGEKWWDYMQSHPDLEMYAEDGAHASAAGSAFAARQIWETIELDVKRNRTEF